MKVKLAILFLMVFLIDSLQAQRYLPGQWGVQFSGGFLDGLKLSKGGHLNLSFSRYTDDRNRWMYGVNLSKKKCQKGGEVYQYVADFSFWVPFVGDRGKNVFLSAGAGLSAGYEQVCDREKKLTPSMDYNRFLYGGYVGMEVEFFMNNRFILVMNAREHYLKSTPYKNACQIGDFRFNLGVGLKYILNY